jgi:hypothetical protein
MLAAGSALERGPRSGIVPKGAWFSKHKILPTRDTIPDYLILDTEYSLPAKMMSHNSSSRNL